MPESYTINFRETTPLSKRVSEVKKRLSVWLASLEEPYDPNKDILRLIKYEKSNQEYVYEYIIERDMKSLKRVNSNNE